MHSRGSIRQFRYWQTRAHCTLSSPGRPHGSDSRHKTISITKNSLNCKKNTISNKVTVSDSSDFGKKELAALSPLQGDNMEPITGAKTISITKTISIKKQS